MKKLYNVEFQEMMYKFQRYNQNPEIKSPTSEMIYRNKVQRFMNKLNELEKEFGFSLYHDWSEDYDGFTTSSLLLFDETYGQIGEIVDEEDEDEV